MTTDIELVGKALTDFDAVAAGLEQLNKTYKGVLFDIETPKGMELAKASRAVLRKPRYEIERIRKEAKAPLLAIGKKLDAEAARITSAIMELEDPIDAQIKNEEQRKEREQLEKAAAEQKRVDSLKARVAAIRDLPNGASLKSSAEVLSILERAQALPVDDTFQEFLEEAKSSIFVAIKALTGIYHERVAAEAEQSRIVAERAELERLRAEQAERERQDRVKREAEEKAAREKLAAEQAELARQRREENDRIAAEQAKQQAVIDAENRRLAEERAAFERQQAEARRKEEAEVARKRAEEEAERKRKEEAALAAKKAKYPGDAAILSALTKHFGVSESVVRGWLSQLKVAA